MKTNDLILIGALGIGAYFLYNMLKGGIEKIVEPVTGTWDTITKPGINFIPGMENVNVPDLITKPGYQLLGDALKDKLPELDLRPGYQILGDMLNQKSDTKKLPGNTPRQIAANKEMAAIRKSVPMYDAGRYVALDTKRIQPYTAPAQQIETYNVAPKLVKVGNAFKKVM